MGQVTTSGSVAGDPRHGIVLEGGRGNEVRANRTFRGEATMIGYLVLAALQFGAAWFGAPQALKYIPVSGDPKTFIHAAIFAVIVWVVGVVGSLVLKDVRMPTTSTLATALVFALICAGLLFVPQVMQAIPFKFDRMFLPLAGAILGYMFRR
jgi:hypothetical protein